MAATRPIDRHGNTLEFRSTESLREDVANGWKYINFIVIADELAWRDAQDDREFEALIELEGRVQGEKASAAMGATPAIRWNAQRRLPRAKAALFAAVDALNPERLAAYSAWRRAYLNG